MKCLWAWMIAGFLSGVMNSAGEDAAWKHYDVYVKAGKSGFRDTRDGSIVVEAKFDSAHMFSDGMAKVQNGRLWGFIDASGAIVVPLKHPHAIRFKEGFAGVVLPDPESEDTGSVFIDRTGKHVFNRRFRSVDNFSEGLAMVSVARKKYGYINRSGEIVIKPIYAYAKPFSSGRAIVTMEERIKPRKKYTEVSVMNEVKRVFGDEFADELSPEMVKLMVEQWRTTTKRLCAFIDQSGKLVTPFIYEYATFFNEGRAAVRKGGKWGYIDLTGDEVIPCTFAEAGLFRNGKAHVKVGDKVNGNWADGMYQGKIGKDGKFLDRWRFDRKTKKTIHF